MTGDVRVLLLPEYRGPDRADGGIRRVVEGQRQWLPEFGIELVDSMARADVVATHALENPNVPVGQPWVVHNHGLYYQEFGWEAAWYQEANRRMVRLLRAADHVTAPSEWVAQTLRRGMWLRPTVLYHGVNPEEWDTAGGQSEGYVLWNKARSDAASDPAPVAELARRAPDLRFVTTFGDTLPNVRVTGALPYTEAQAVVKAAGVYLCTTRETLGIGTLEALAAGVPVVGWAWGGQREIVRHGETGWLATPGDYDGLLTGIRWALSHRQRIAEAARADVAARWTWEQAIRRYAELYRQLSDSSGQLRDAPKVSIVIPCYNLGRFLGDALQSVQAQTLADYECIVVDDASTDDTAAVAATFTTTDPRFRYLRNESNLHVSATRNRGMQAARGRYLVPLDADDMITPQTLELLAGALDADRGLHLAYGSLQLMSETGVLRDSLNEWPGQFDFKQQIQGKNQVPTLCMFRRELFERTGGYRSRLSPVEDADLWTRAASLGFVPRKVTEAATLLYRLRANSLSRTLPNPEWAHWYPWSRSRALLPFAAAVDPPAGSVAWPVSTYEPVKIAVIIPVGPGHERIVIDALDSVEAQTFRQWEVCVVNDTGAPLPFVPSWARVIETPGRIGVAAARNAGIAATGAPLLLFLDADDYLQPEALETLVNVQRDVGGVVYSQWYDDQGDGNSAGRVYDPPEYDARLLTQRGCIHAVTALYPRTAVADVGGFDAGLSHWEDWDLQLALAARGVCGTKVPRPLWTYRKATGKRRDANMAAFDDGKRAVLAKWGRVWDGKEELMACRSCPGGGGRRMVAPPSLPANGSGDSAAQAAAGGLVLVETLEASEGTRTYRGRATGAQYRFGNTATDKRKYVHAADAEHLLAMPNKFRRVEEAPAGVSAAAPAPRLEAPGSAVMLVGVDWASERGDEQRLSFPPLSDSDAVVAVRGVAEKLSYAEMKARVKGWTPEQAAAALEQERAGENRTPVVKLLETAVYGAPLAGVPEGAGV